MATREERETMQRFAERYRDGRTDVTEQIERAVIGGTWGANGYTTISQADRLGELLHLEPGQRLLDLGAGQGWPGLYLAASTGCEAVLSDIPLEGLVLASARAEAERLARRVAVVAGSARALPLRSGVFDAIVHTDVLC
jgi:SAM-dependent methyltransferase